MPAAGANFRGDQLAYLASHTNQLWKDPELADLIAEHIDLKTGLPTAVLQSADHAHKQFWIETWREHRKQTATPTALAEALAKVTSKAFTAWQESCQSNKLHPFSGALQEVLDLSKELATVLRTDPGASLYDVHLDLYETGQTAVGVQKLFDPLKKWTLAFLEKIPKGEAQKHLKYSYSLPLQEKLCNLVFEWLQLPRDKMRLDSAPHPFCCTIHHDDVRITTRYHLDRPLAALEATLHEAGHALYELGLPAKWYGTPVGESSSLTVHESQSRLFEVMFGCSPAFLGFLHRTISEIEPQYSDSVQDLIRETHQVHPGYIRINADPITYNLHVILRFEIEKALFDGQLSLADLPAAWNEKVTQYLGLPAPTHLKDGCFQDIHWAHGSFGYFPTYTKGNLLAAQIYQTLGTALPNLQELLSQGEFAPMISWLRTHVHQLGKFYTTDEIAQKATGQPIGIDALVHFLEKNYQY